MKKVVLAILVLTLETSVAWAGPYDSIYVNVTGDTMTGTLNVKQAKAAGPAAAFRINNAANTGTALNASTTGLGPAAYFKSSNPNTNATTLVVSSDGKGGGAGYFEVLNASSHDAALWAETAGDGPAGYFKGRVQTTKRLDVGGALYVNLAANFNGEVSVNGDVWMQSDAGVQGGLGVTGLLQAGSASVGGELFVGGTTSLNGGVNVTGLLNANNDISASGNLSTLGTLFVNGAATLKSNLDVQGALTSHTLSVSGTKQFVQPHPTDPSKELAYVSMEGPESAIFLRGTARLVDGRATIEMPDYFRMVAAESGTTVQFTPRSAKSKGLAAVEVSRDRVQVAELLEGTGSYEFDYFVTARRDGFQGHQPIQPNIHFTANDLTPEAFEAKFTGAADAATVATRKLLVADGILTTEGKLNRETAAKLGWKVREQEAALATGR